MEIEYIRFESTRKESLLFSSARDEFIMTNVGRGVLPTSSALLEVGKMQFSSEEVKRGADSKRWHNIHHNFSEPPNVFIFEHFVCIFVCIGQGEST